MAEAFPPYSYVPRMFPHPSRDEGGHSVGVVEGTVAPLVPDRWRDCPEYLHGLELFNHGYYWEAHEAWEGVWHAVGREGEIGDFLKALIKLAAAGVKAREGNEKGVRRAALRALELFGHFDQSSFCGLDLKGLMSQATSVAERASEFLETRTDPVVVVFPFRLETATHAD